MSKAPESHKQQMHELETNLANLTQDFFNSSADARGSLRTKIIDQTLWHCSLSLSRDDVFVMGTRDALASALNLLEAAQRERIDRTYDPCIDVVHVISGPGTYFKPVKNQQPPYSNEEFRWMDRDRIKAGLVAVRNITRSRLGLPASAELSVEQLQSAPRFFYNGNAEENAAFHQAEEKFPVPKEKIIVSESEIVRTDDQIRDLFEQVETPESRIFGAKNIALITHLSELTRVPFYVQKYTKEHMVAGENVLRLWVYALRNRKGSRIPGGREDTLGECVAPQLTRLAEYIQKGYLPVEPWQFENL